MLLGLAEGRGWRLTLEGYSLPVWLYLSLIHKREKDHTRIHICKEREIERTIYMYIYTYTYIYIYIHIERQRERVTGC